jgi:hypothetical protein
MISMRRKYFITLIVGFVIGILLGFAFCFVSNEQIPFVLRVPTEKIAAAIGSMVFPGTDGSAGLFFCIPVLCLSCGMFGAAFACVAFLLWRRFFDCNKTPN